VSGSQCVDDIRAAVAALNRGELDGYLRRFEPSSVRRVDGIEEPFSLSSVTENLGHLFCIRGVAPERRASFWH
jgi:hypothetical protein